MVDRLLKAAMEIGRQDPDLLAALTLEMELALQECKRRRAKPRRNQQF